MKFPMEYEGAMANCECLFTTYEEDIRCAA